MKSFATFLVLVVAAVLGSSANAFTPDSNVYYKLVTSFREPFNECLEVNRVSPDSTLGGAAFMAPCTSTAANQMWKFIRQPSGVYRMKTLSLENEHKCLEGNAIGARTLGGAAFMHTCLHVTGQKWKIKPVGAYFTLTNLFREPFGECLEGNRFAASSTLNGAAFMSHCLPFTGQLWKAIRI